jgi:hypothetical protein
MDIHKGILDKYDYNNTSHIEYLQYKEYNNKVMFKKRYYYMYLIDIFDDNNIKIKNYNINNNNNDDDDNNDDNKLCYCDLIDKYIIDIYGNKKIYIDELYNIQINTYNAEIWLAEIKKLNIIISKTLLIKINKNDINKLIKYKKYLVNNNSNKNNINLLNNKYKCELHENINNIINKHYNIKYWFIKLGSVSPKDLYNGVGKYIKFNNSVDIINTIIYSNRTWNTLMNNIKNDNYLLLSEWIDIPSELEFRCFIYKDKLRAISQYGDNININNYNCIDKYNNNDKRINLYNDIIKFYNNIKFNIPYNDCIMDIIIIDDNKSNSLLKLGIFIIEFNCFGAETPAGSGLFNWISDSHILYNSEKPVLRLLSYDNDNIYNDIIDIQI